MFLDKKKYNKKYNHYSHFIFLYYVTQLYKHFCQFRELLKQLRYISQAIIFEILIITQGCQVTPKD